MFVTEVANALKKDERFETLRLLNEGYTLSEITDELNMSFAGVQSYYQDLEEAYLVEEVDGTRQVTDAGQIVLDRFNEMEDELQSFRKEQIHPEATQNLADLWEAGMTRDEFTDMLEESGIPPEEVREMLGEETTEN